MLLTYTWATFTRKIHALGEGSCPARCQGHLHLLLCEMHKWEAICILIHVNSPCEQVRRVGQHLLLHLDLGRGEGGGEVVGIAASADEDDGLGCEQLDGHHDGLDESSSLILSYQTRLYLLESSRIASPIIHSPGSR